jgi:hypothetical protein
LVSFLRNFKFEGKGGGKKYAFSLVEVGAGGDVSDVETESDNGGAQTNDRAHFSFSLFFLSVFFFFFFELFVFL